MYYAYEMLLNGHLGVLLSSGVVKVEAENSDTILEYAYSSLVLL